MGWIHEGAAVQLTLTIDIRALDELLVVHDDDFLLSFAYAGTSGTERHVSTLDRAKVDNTITNLELVGSVLWEQARPVGEAFHVEELRRQELSRAHLQIHIVVVGFDVLPVVVDGGDHRCLKRIEAHVHEWKRRDRQLLDPLGDLFDLAHSVRVFSAKHVSNARHLVLLPDFEGDGEDFGEFLLVFAQDVNKIE